MITAIAATSPAIADAFVRSYGLQPLPETFGTASAAYRKGNVVLAVSESPDVFAELRKEYSPGRIYVASFGVSANSERYAGDVVLPNAFYPHSEPEDGDGEEGAVFLENYDEQEDYDFESFGLSVGGVCVSLDGEPDDETLVSISSEYGADVVDRLGTETVRRSGASDECPIFPVYGVVGGIVGNEEEDVKEETVARNLAAVVRFLEDTLGDESGGDGSEEDGEDEDSVTEGGDGLEN